MDLGIGKLAFSSMDVSADFAGANALVVRPMMRWMSSSCRGIIFDMLLSMEMSDLCV